MRKSISVFAVVLGLFTVQAGARAAGASDADASSWAGDFADKNLALIYKGPGSCTDGCSYAAALAAQKAGFKTYYVGPTNNDPKLFDRAAVWVQPGGKSTEVALNMTDELKQRIRDFVAGGGGYVGFCAGGFFATDYIGTSQERGLGILPGFTQLYDGVPDEATVVKLEWYGKTRSLYWEGGPAFYPPIDTTTPAQVTATYSDGSIASERIGYGLGRVYVTGAHPEATKDWFDYFGLKDDDGLDTDLAVDMIRWAARVSN